MRIFYDTNTWGGKINFVDENNRLVGYDLTQDCCEHADWFIRDTIHKSPMDDEHNDLTSSGEEEQLNEDLKDFVFDKDFEESIGYDVCFRLINENGDEKFLRLYNVHEGYYSHGFEIYDDGVLIKEEYI